MEKISRKPEKDRLILAAARANFGRHGLDGASMDQISKDAEVSKRTLYKYYQNKDVLFDALVEALFSEVNSQLSFRFDPSLSLQELIRLVIEAKLSLITDPRFLDVARLLLVEQLKSAQSNSLISKRLEESKSSFEVWVSRCQEAKKIGQEHSVGDVSLYFHSFFDGLVLWPMLLNLEGKKSIVDWKESCELLETAFLKRYENK
ncbi:MAG: TetR/AcrR family transcriptional regulator [Pseudobacteriovorax sp.]|nr:TetR/AcrR family transcriptional regulator [Pseudobacteriovorax sp.]